MVELPSEITYDILSRLPVKSLSRFRCVSKPWCNYINDSYLETMHAKRASYDPILIIFHQFTTDSDNSPSPCKLSFLEHKDQENGSCTLEVPKKPPVIKFMCKDCNTRFPKDIVLGSCNGLLYSSHGRRDSNALVVINPLTKEIYDLPPINKPLASLQQSWGVDSDSDWGIFEKFGLAVEETTGLGFDDSTNTFKMVSVVIREHKWAPGFNRVDEGMYTMVHVLGTNSWRKIQQVPRYPITGEGVYANGRLHWLSRSNDEHDDHYMVTFDMVNEEFDLIKLPQKRSRLPYDKEQLVDLHGEIGYVDNRVLNYHIRVWVLKRKEWVTHCEFEPKPPLVYSSVKVLGFWNENGDILLTNSLYYNQIFVYELASDKLYEVNFVDWSKEADKDMRMFQGSLFSSRYKIKE